jgi:hypothetical protein
MPAPDVEILSVCGETETNHIMDTLDGTEIDAFCQVVSEILERLTKTECALRQHKVTEGD